MDTAFVYKYTTISGEKKAGIVICKEMWQVIDYITQMEKMFIPEISVSRATQKEIEMYEPVRIDKRSNS